MVDQYDDGREKDTKDPLIPLNKKDKPEKQVAVALKYVRSPDAVPEVTAAGRGKIAEKILQIAYENGIHVREDGDLAEMLASMDRFHGAVLRRGVYTPNCRRQPP